MATGGDDSTAQRVLRITDIAEEPLEFLAPISGYAKTPLVSLEKAVEPLVDILPEVQSHAYVAKQRCKKPADGLTPDESASIMLYTIGWEPLDECLYIALNKTLREKDRQQKLKPWYSYIRLLLNGLLRLPPIHKTVYRGVKLDMSKKYTNEEPIVWWGFSSCTTKVEVLQTDLFLGETGARTMFTLECDSLRDIRKHSYIPQEDEMLLLPATQFEVHGCLRQGDLCIIQLKETRPPVPLLQLVSVITPTGAVSSTDPKPISSTEQVTYKKSIVETTSSTTKTTATVPPQKYSKLPKPTYKNIELEKRIAENKNATELDLSLKKLTDQDMEIVAYYAIQENKTLTTLYLYANQIGDKGAQHLSEALRQNTTLTTLNLNSNQIGDKGAQHLSEALRQNTTLTTLNLNSNQIGDKGAQHLSEALRQNTTLTTLNLNSNQIGDKGAQHLSEALRQNTTLTTLNLNSNQIGDKGAQHLSEALRQNTTLTTLYLYANQIGAAGAQHLSEALRQNTTLTTLNLNSNQIGDKGAQHLSEALRQNTTLTTLNLNSNQIGDKGAQHLSEALRQNTTLTTLNLNSNQIGDKGAQHLSEALRQNTTLTTLYLNRNQIGDKSAQHLSEALRQNTTLTTLDLSYNQIGDYLGCTRFEKCTNEKY